MNQKTLESHMDRLEEGVSKGHCSPKFALAYLARILIEDPLDVPKQEEPKPDKEAELTIIRSFFAEANASDEGIGKIQLIRALRAIYGLDLKTAKDIVESK
jgi:ribosomal protein L7/L12